MYVYIQSEKAGKDHCVVNLWTVGFYSPDGEWQPESDYDSPTDAAKRCAFLNGTH